MWRSTPAENTVAKVCFDRFLKEDDTLADRDAEALKAVLTDCFGMSSPGLQD